MATDAALSLARKGKQRTLDRWEFLKRERASWEPVWRDAADYLLPRRNPDGLEVPGALRPRLIVDNTGVVAADRLASTLSGFLVSPFSPFLAPKLDDGEPTREEALWFEQVSQIMFRHLTGSGSTFRVSFSEALIDSVALGTNVTFIGAQDRAAPFYQVLPISKVWLAENPETARVDTVMREFSMPLWRAIQRYPQTPKLDEKLKNPKTDRNEMVRYLHAVEPREGGKDSAAAHERTFGDVTIHAESGEVVDADGWNDLPFAVSRFQKLSGQAYGYGPGIQALPMIKGLNVLLETCIMQAEYAADPPLMDFTGGQIAEIDRRAGATIPVDPTLWRGRTAKPFERLFDPTDIRPAKDIIADFRNQIQFTMYTDWLNLRDSGNMTATEVNDRRETRLRTMSPVVARMEQEMLNPIAERSFTLMERAGMFPPPPESLVGRDISFGYSSPLAMAQRQSENESFLRAIEFAVGAAQAEPSAVQELDISAITRKAAKNYGVPEAFLVDQARLAAARAQEQSQQQIEAALGQASVAAGAAQSGAQALASLQGAGAAA